MGNLLAVVVAAAVGAVIAIPTMQLITSQSKSRASLEARILYESEVDRARRLWSIDNTNFAAFKLYSKYCKIESGNGYVTDGFNFQSSCTVGGQKVGDKPVILAYPAMSRNPGQYTDNDKNGFEDLTGLPTAEDKCYDDDWKGTSFNKGCSLDDDDDDVKPLYKKVYKDKDDD